MAARPPKPRADSSRENKGPAGRVLPDDALDRLNRRIINRLVGEGSFFLAPTVLKGRTALRVAIVNFRTSEGDLEFLLDEVERIGVALRRQGAD